jgi:hypothetical protein
VAQQVVGELQCLEGSLIDAHLDMWLDIISSFAKFQIWHISKT